MDTKTFEFDVTMADLLDADGLNGLNEILDERMADRGIQHTATDISYDLTGLHREDGAEGLLTIVATYVPDFDLMDEDEIVEDLRNF